MDLFRLAALALLLPVPCADDLHLAELAATARAAADAPALGLVVVRKGAAPQVAVDGVRVAGSDASVEPGDKWHLGSISKSMTATLVARLVEKKVVAWDDTVEQHLGEAVPDMEDDYRDVTFLHLLSHRAGLPANIPHEHFATFGQRPDDPIADRLEWVTIALAQPAIGAREAHYAYSNDGIIVAGAMLEAASGEAWEVLMQREVFAPLGIESAGFGPPRGTGPHDQPRGHRPAGGADTAMPGDADNPAALGPAGRVHMSLADIARYLTAHAEERSDFLSPASYATLHTPPFGGNYALGWIVTNADGRWHNGSNTMWYAEAAFDHARGRSAAVVVNDGDLANVQPAVAALLARLLE